MDTASQKKLILETLKRGETLTPDEAKARFRCGRLAPRIKELRNEGWPIETEMVKIPGTRVKYARYRYVPTELRLF